MRKFRSLWSGPVLALVLAGLAHAGMLATSGIFSGSDTQLVDCLAINVGESPIASVTVQLVPTSNSDGKGDSFTCVNVPGETCEDLIDTPPFFSGHCKIIFTGSRKNVRASVSLIASGNNLRVELPAE
jgi:hypothetical protein